MTSKLVSEELPDLRVTSDFKVRFRDLRVAEPALRTRLLEVVEDVLINGPILMGPRVKRFERELSKFCGREYCVALSSGTDALYLALRAFKIGTGDEVITTPMSWVATLNAIVMTGAKPIFVDVRTDQNLDPTQVEKVITERTKAIVPVHFTGRLCDMAEIMGIAQRHGLLVIEDAAQAMGASKIGYRAGSVGNAATFSLNPMKVFPGYGEAGAVVTDDPEIDERLRMFRYLGTRGNEVCIEAALNHKMDEIQAAMLLTGFDFINGIVEERIEMARYYSRRLSSIVTCPSVPAIGDCSSNFYDYVILADGRDELRKHLHSNGIETKVKHHILLPDHPAYKSDVSPNVPVAKQLVRRMVSLPLHDKMTFDDLDFVCDVVEEYFRDK